MASHLPTLLRSHCSPLFNSTKTTQVTGDQIRLNVDLTTRHSRLCQRCAANWVWRYSEVIKRPQSDESVGRVRNVPHFTCIRLISLLLIFYTKYINRQEKKWHRKSYATIGLYWIRFCSPYVLKIHHIGCVQLVHSAEVMTCRPCTEAGRSREGN